MDLGFQEFALERLRYIAKNDNHSVLISGIRGCGKTYLASCFAKMKNIDTFHSVQPKISEIRNALDDSYSLDDNQVICIENLDDGVVAASQALLKYLEEPRKNTYVIITCVNEASLTNTIPSRSISVHVNPPSDKDLSAYLHRVCPDPKRVEGSVAFESCKSISDVKYLSTLDYTKVRYYDKFATNAFFKKSTDSVLWELTHYEDNSKCDPVLALRCVLAGECDYNLKLNALDSLIVLESKRCSEYSVLGNFVTSIR